MIDQIFADIMKEARSRKGKDLVMKLSTVHMEVSQRIIAAIEGLRADERSKEKHEE